MLGRFLLLALLPAAVVTLQAVATPTRCDALLRSLFVDAPAVSPSTIASVCSPTVEWVDMNLDEPIKGPSKVREMLESKFPSGARLVVDKLADGDTSGGFVWHREDEEGVEGLRGITYVELNAEGQISYVQEGQEPIFKLDKLLEALLQAANANKPADAAKAEATYERASPTTAEGIVRYLWETAYPGGASPTEALEFFADDILYEDFNYYEPFRGIGPVSEYIGMLDVFPDFVFIPERISQGDKGCCLTWRCEVNGEPGPAGISYNEVDGAGKISFARDIPAPSLKPPPLAALAATLRPKLRTFAGRRTGKPTMMASPEAAPPPSVLETVSSRPARSAMALAWLGFSAYVALFSPGSFDTANPDSFDNRLIADAIADPASLNGIFFFIFNALGVIPAINLAVLLPGSKDQRPLPALPFLTAAFALGYGAAGPYLALREPRGGATASSEVGFFTRYVTESRLYGGGLVAAALALYYGLLTMPDTTAATAGFAELFATSKLVHVSTIDFFILSTFSFEPIREDMSRRGWWVDGAEDNNVARLLAFSAIPLIGPAAYLLLRPSLEDEN